MLQFHKYMSNALKPVVFGMVHLAALPGTPKSQQCLETIEKKAVTDGRIYAEEGLIQEEMTALIKDAFNFYTQDGIIVENMGDIPYVLPRDVGPEIVASMTRIAMRVRHEANECRPNMLYGVACLAGCNKEALSIAHACGFDFIRVEGFVFAHVADEGLINGCAGSLLRYRKQIGADGIAILADIKKKHSSHAITADISLADTAKAAEFFLADGVIVTGTHTGHAPDSAGVQETKSALRSVPVLVGSGVTAENVTNLFDARADAFIVGSHFKKDGHWEQVLERDRIRRFMQKVVQLRKRCQL